MSELTRQPALMKMFEIKRVVKENDSNKTFYLKKFVDSMPGQFAMVWIPGVDEKPFSVMNFGKSSAINIEVKGKWSEKLFGFKKGDKIGLRGPFGNSFSFEKTKKACIVAGGVGVVPLLPLAEKLKKAGAKTVFVLGAKTKKKLLFKKQLKKTVSKLVVSTDDGTEGKKGFVTGVLDELLEKEKFDCVFTCGPEQMMLGVLELCKKHGAKVQASLERFMKCGIGVCGACMVNDRIVCTDGPVFGSKELLKLSEFGKTAYLKSGKRCSLEEFYGWKTP